MSASQSPAVTAISAMSSTAATTLAAQPIFTNKREILAWEKAYDILQSQEGSYTQCNVPPVKPKSGEVFLYHASDVSKRST